MVRTELAGMRHEWYGQTGAQGKLGGSGEAQGGFGNLRGNFVEKMKLEHAWIFFFLPKQTLWDPSVYKDANSHWLWEKDVREEL